MFKRILIANRGEIAVRIIRACREMNIETVAVYSKSDADSLHVQLATEAVCIGDSKPAKSYLNMVNIMSAAINYKCQAIHPGYGFLSENSKFASICEKSGIKFIGPKAEVIDSLGDKVTARKLMIENGIPVVPGYEGEIKDEYHALEIAKSIGFPVLVKASAGGGGRGMRRVFEEETFIHDYLEAKAESMNCFGKDEMYIEKLIINPRHIEFQILADEYGNVVHLGERDCSMQRRNQKMLEESPAMGLDEKLREEMGNAAVKAAKIAGYTNAGTVEFILDEDKNYYFIEMNTRIQVEHPVTEMVTGINLVAEQIRIAAGNKLDFEQSDIKMQGHVIECRINAENPKNNFMPSVGKVEFLHFPGGYDTRVDSYLYNGYDIPPFYDSMLAKVIVKGDSRLEAIRRMRRALEELVIEGVITNAEFNYLLLYHPDFIKGNYNTGFLEKHIEEILEWDEGADSESGI